MDLPAEARAGRRRCLRAASAARHTPVDRVIAMLTSSCLPLGNHRCGEQLLVPYSTITILNDTPDLVVVDDCQGGYCLQYATATTLAPRQSPDDHATCGTTLSAMNSWRVISHGRLIGYIAVDLPRNQDGLVFRVSNASSHRVRPTPPG
jgi:hypothetical protein